MVIQTLCFALARRVGAFLLGGLILWQVAEHSGLQRGQAIVHVSTPQVDVMVDEARYSVETLWDTPIVCDLRPGLHTVRMLRSGRVVYEEEFTIAVGQELILTAWNGYDDGRSPKQAGREKGIRTTDAETNFDGAGPPVNADALPISRCTGRAGSCSRRSASPPSSTETPGSTCRALSPTH